MNYIFLPPLLLSLTLLYFGLKWAIALFRNQTVGKFPFNDNEHTFTVNKPGLYSINIIGAGWSENQGSFFPAIKPEHKNESLELTIPFISAKSMSNWVKMTEYAHFTAETTGTYTLQCNNITDLTAKQSQLISQRIFQNNIHPSYLGICIKQALSTRRTATAIIFTILGVQGTVVSLLGVFNIFARFK